MPSSPSKQRSSCHTNVGKDGIIGATSSDRNRFHKHHNGYQKHHSGESSAIAAEEDEEENGSKHAHRRQWASEEPSGVQLMHNELAVAAAGGVP